MLVKLPKILWREEVRERERERGEERDSLTIPPPPPPAPLLACYPGSSRRRKRTFEALTLKEKKNKKGIEAASCSLCFALLACLLTGSFRWGPIRWKVGGQRTNERVAFSPSLPPSCLPPPSRRPPSYSPYSFFLSSTKSFSSFFPFLVIRFLQLPPPLSFTCSSCACPNGSVGRPPSSSVSVWRFALLRVSKVLNMQFII